MLVIQRGAKVSRNVDIQSHRCVPNAQQRLVEHFAMTLSAIDFNSPNRSQHAELCAHPDLIAARRKRPEARNPRLRITGASALIVSFKMSMPRKLTVYPAFSPLRRDSSGQA